MYYLTTLDSSLVCILCHVLSLTERVPWLVIPLQFPLEWCLRESHTRFFKDDLCLLNGTGFAYIGFLSLCNVCFLPATHCAEVLLIVYCSEAKAAPYITVLALDTTGNLGSRSFNESSPYGLNDYSEEVCGMLLTCASSCSPQSRSLSLKP